ncbi:hypothetical protein [Chondromyces crocatus]|uniref:hypothetical protein n=1 Tax=Chondromyces crocatus TaxID=52 RepID=UPI001C54F44B|nr:hypothetical protein [Chondromyces crocatus]
MPRAPDVSCRGRARWLVAAALSLAAVLCGAGGLVALAGDGANAGAGAGAGDGAGVDGKDARGASPANGGERAEGATPVQEVGASSARPLGTPPRPAEVAPPPSSRRPWAAGRRPAAPPPLEGKTYDFALDAKVAGGAEKSWLGRAFVHPRAAEEPRPMPLLVFLHGINGELIRYRWMGGGQEGDVRRIASELMDAGSAPPMLVAAPSAVIPAATAVARTSWPQFDLARFVDLTVERLAGIATVDRSRIVVVGHSGGGCNATGGIVSAVHGAMPVHAALVVDVCMDADVAARLGRVRDTTHVVVSWQTLSWAKRPFRDFERVFRREVAQSPAAPGVLRELEHLRPLEPMPHDAMVPLVLRRWLPALLGPDALPDVPCVSP